MKDKTMSHADERWLDISVKARVALLPSPVGRSSPIQTGYRPNHQLPSGDFCMGIFTSMEGGQIAPGESALVEIRFMVVEPWRGFFEAGYVWNINEGSRKVGSGEILAVTEVRQSR
ncbi:hypothetical protein PO883_08420 [Massilia sp. DJPM01]|uniref:hypothetical protein n=1 Tax=Massilia sp. DJPM01 TaxID=3024404 RepID=UPI00259E565C|nr:hypothetical protein [Massilia sp. DJPM01]MDM5177218.1 hypothetical protein [Massilia sp. DJPM01]